MIWFNFYSVILMLGVLFTFWLCEREIENDFLRIVTIGIIVMIVIITTLYFLFQNAQVR